MTAAGKTKPANIFIAGGGVAGLSALQTAHKLGAIVKVNDIRPSVKEQVESLGGQFVTHNEKLEGEGRGG
jgi:NAD/NADP transhydrogenase alpha subunit